MTVDVAYWESIDSTDLFAEVASEENLNFVEDLMGRLTPDPLITDIIVNIVRSGQIELRALVAWMSRQLQPSTYLEIGVRRGFSMAAVAARCLAVEIYGFDMWLRNYVGVPNPGPRFVRDELQRLGYAGKLHLISGDSHKTLPAFFRAPGAGLWQRLQMDLTLPHRPSKFDLIVVDGDHSLLGAYQDLCDTLPRVRVGGALIFDDIAPDLMNADMKALQKELGADPYEWESLLGVWHAVQPRFANFRYFDYTQTSPGMGLAVRLR